MLVHEDGNRIRVRNLLRLTKKENYLHEKTLRKFNISTHIPEILSILWISRVHYRYHVPPKI